ncbi:amino acid ABC transporter permease [Dactylosporangium matsuzakiense]|uniref:Amino acid ABC transporter permease n=1 Tax=Dactylosporangium matsuzakiense TaxID=53360 RepID=A0A9W6KEA8_9ACTN|nr:amino acid ABC transporter permease [Dactylosporangium matsuzakiense]GLK99316.1 amino acid ABC transporter permease [Dactylosporangium matsuzakiense]
MSEPATLQAPPAPPPSALDPRIAHRPVTPRPRPLRWIVSAIVLVVLAQFVSGIFTNSRYEWFKFWPYFTRQSVLDGVVVTLEVVGLSAVFGLLVGVVVALGRLSSNPLIGGLAWAYVWFFRALPLPLLLIITFNFSYFYPRLGVGIPWGPVFADVRTASLTPLAIGVIALSLNEAAYAAEVIRGGILAVEPGQIEAADALGLSRARQLRRVILPQALRSIVPAYGNQLIGLIKASSLVYYVSLLDVFGAVFVLESRHPESLVPILIVGAAWYLLLTAVLSILQFYVERFYARGSSRALPPTPVQRLRRLTADSWGRLAGVRLTRRGY